MTTMMPQDLNDNPIPALRMKAGKAHKIVVGATSARNSVAFEDSTQIISIYADTDSYIAFGDNTITATTSDHFIPKGLYYDLSIGGDNTRHYTNMAAIQVSGAGNLYISEKQ